MSGLNEIKPILWLTTPLCLQIKIKQSNSARRLINDRKLLNFFHFFSSSMETSSCFEGVLPYLVPNWKSLIQFNSGNGRQDLNWTCNTTLPWL